MISMYKKPRPDWKRRQLKSTVQGPTNGAWGDDAGKDDYDARCIRVADFDWPHLCIHSENPTVRSFNRAQFKRLKLQKGDLIIEKSGGGDKTPVGRVVEFNSDEEAVTSNFVARMRVEPGHNGAFIKYLFAAHYISGFSKQFIKQATGIQNLDDNQFLQSACWLPDEDEQSAIADYLDRETGRIDGLIEYKTRFIALLKEKRAAVIDHAVTKGIDRNVEMKPSGVEWIGDIPAHWDAPRIATLFREAFRTPDPDLPVLSVSIHNGVSDGELSDEERDRKVALSEDRTKYQGVEPGDLVYNMMRAWQGAFGAVAVSGLVSPAYVVARPIAEFRTKFLEHLLHTKSAAEEIRRYSRGIADFRMRLYWEYFRDIRVCLPPLSEQDEILSHIDRETARIEGLIEKTERSIALLKEKRAALITAAVTGKIDVRAAA